jgi:Fic family protein
VTPDQFTAHAPGRLVPTTAVDVVRSEFGVRSETVTGVAFVPDALPPRLDPAALAGELLGPISAVNTTMARLDQSLQSLPAAGLLAVRPFVLREATLSSRIEDTFASAAEVSTAEARTQSAREDAREVLNLVQAIEHAFDSPLPMSKRLICDIHAILLRGVRGSHLRPGQFRNGQVYIGGRGGFTNATFVPPPAALIHECLDNWERFANAPDAREDRFPAVIRIAIAHYQFEAIHPFFDGNGRVGRLIALLSLAALGPSRPVVPISAYIDQNRAEYYRLLLRVSTHAEWAPWCRYFCDAVATQATDAVTRAAKLVELRAQFTQRTIVRRRGPHLDALLDALFRRPAFTVASMAQALATTPQTVQKHVDRLLAAGILKEATGRLHDRIFIVPEILAFVELSSEELLGTTIRTGT